VVNLFDNANILKQIKSYLSLLDEYKKTLDKYQKKLDAHSVSEEDKMAAVQVALDLTYLKEELDELRPNQDQISNEIASLQELMQEVTQTQKQIVEKLGGIDNLIIEPVNKNYTANRMEIIEKFEQVLEVTKKKSRLMVISLIVNVICSGALIGVILFLLNIIISV